MVTGSWATVSFQGILVIQSRVPDDLVSSFTEKVEDVQIVCERADLYDAPGLCPLTPTMHLFIREERSVIAWMYRQMLLIIFPFCSDGDIHFFCYFKIHQSLIVYE